MPRCIRFRNLLAAGPGLCRWCHGSHQAIYLMRCGGCHGIEGRSASAVVPDLRDQVGLFLCSGEGRTSMLRVPNVSMSLIRDDAGPADVMNFVVSQFGGSNRPANTRPFTATEVHEARQQPLRATDLSGLRRAILERAVTACTP